MSVIVHGMEMPRSCGECKLVSGYLLYEADPHQEPMYGGWYCRATRKKNKTDGRPTWCPLEEGDESGN